MGRDRVWADMYEAAKRLSEKYGFAVRAVSRREGFHRVQGFATSQPRSFESVRGRRLFSRRWDQTQRVDLAANRIGSLLRAASELCDACGHAAMYHPGFTRVRICAGCIEAEDHGRVAPEAMCRAEFTRPEVAER